MGRWVASAPVASLSSAWTTFVVGQESSVPVSTDLPANCDLVSVVILLSSINTASTVTVAIAHNDTGTNGVTPFTPTGATQTINVPSSGDGYVAFTLGSVWIAEAGEKPRVRVKLDAGTATGQAKLYASTDGGP